MIDLRAAGAELTEIKVTEDGVTKKYKVDNVYPFIVQCHDESGVRTCFSIGDLITMGVLNQNRPRYGNAYKVN